MDTLISEIGAEQKSVAETSTKIEIVKDYKRLNNIVVYNLTEGSDNSKVKEKELVLKLLKEISSKKMEEKRLQTR